MDKLICINYVDFEKIQGGFGFKNTSNYLDVKLTNFKNDDKYFRPVKNPTMGKSVFNHIMQLRNQVVIAVENFGGEQKFYPIHIPTMCKDKEEQPKLAYNVVDLVDRPTERYAWLCCCTQWTSQRVLLLNFENLEYWRR